MMDFTKRYQDFVVNEFRRSETDSYRMLANANQMGDKQIKQHFPGWSHRGLTQLLSKWKVRVQKDNAFTGVGTMLNLQMICVLTGLTPNQVLLEEDIDNNRMIRLLSSAALEALAEELKNNKPQEELNCFLPVFVHQKAMYVGFLHIFEVKYGGVSEVYFQFRHCKLGENINAKKTFTYDDSVVFCITNPSRNGVNKNGSKQSLTDFYNENIYGFTSKNLVIDQQNQEFYQLFPEWSEEQEKRNELLFRWYKPEKTRKKEPPKKDGRSLKDMVENASAANRKSKKVH